MKTYFLPERLRGRLQKVWGVSIFGSRGQVEKKFRQIVAGKGVKKIISVGDYCSSALPCQVKIFDGKIRRKKTKKKINFSLTCSNPAGTIQPECWDILKKAIAGEKNVFVKGEEDLLVIPAVLMAPLGAAVVYGCPKKGVCLIDVTSEAKKSFKELLKKFKRF